MTLPLRIKIPYAPRYPQDEIHPALETHRFGVLVAHRRLGKTVLSVNHLIKRAIVDAKERGFYAYIAPFRNQAEQIAWGYLKHYTAAIPMCKVNEQKLSITLPNGVTIRIYGADNPDALRGIEGFSHLWLIWQFSAAVRDTWSPTVRPPRLGGNERVGVFATRSPFRPNAIGLSCVKLEGVRHEDGLGDVLIVSGVDLMDGTPIYDIKPYLPYADAHPEALGGFAPSPKETIEVKSPPELLQKLPEGQREALLGVLAQDPRPQYQNDPERVYGMSFGGWDVKFRVKDGVLTVLSLAETEHQ